MEYQELLYRTNKYIPILFYKMTSKHSNYIDIKYFLYSHDKYLSSIF